MSSKDTDAMSEGRDEKSALVPRLRFPEFRGTSGWNEKPLGVVCNVLNNKRQPISSGQRKSGPFPYYGASGIVDFVDNYLFDERLVLVGEDGAKWGAFENTAFVAEGKYWVNNHAHVLKPVEVSDVLLENYLVMLDLRPYVTGAAPPKLTLAKLKGIPVCFPAAPSEQQKIADCLSSFDELITAETQKLDALKTHKKGLMQRLFPREGETIPRLRFPEFRNTGAWSKVAAGQLFPNRIERGRSGLPIYSVTMTDGLVPRASLDRKIDDIAETGANKTARAGDLAYIMMRMWQGALGIAPEDCMVSPAYIVLEPQGINPFFFYYLLKLPQSLQVLTAHSRGLTEDRLRLYYDDFAKIALQCPSLPEQDRVADCLRSVDNLITAQNQKIDALKTHKRGLMQQLFPVLEEASA